MQGRDQVVDRPSRKRFNESRLRHLHPQQCLRVGQSVYNRHLEKTCVPQECLVCGDVLLKQ
jgi:hypothetical protein